MKKAADTLAGVLVVALAGCALRVAGAAMPSNLALDAAGTSEILGAVRQTAYGVFCYDSTNAGQRTAASRWR